MKALNPLKIKKAPFIVGRNKVGNPFKLSL